MKPQVRFRKMWEGERRVHGKYVFDGDNIPHSIYVNLMTQANPARTFLHELLHYLHPEWSETRVLREEGKRWAKLDTKGRFMLYRRLFNRKFRT